MEKEMENKKKQKKMEYVIEGDVAVFTTSSGVKFMVDLEDANKVSQYRWWIAGNGYVQGWVIGKRVYLHRFVMGSLDSEDNENLVIDHIISGDKLNNCKSNLRWCTQQENLRNRNIKGYRKTSNGKYQAYIYLNGKYVNLGNYDTPEQANSIRVMAEKEYFGEFSSNTDLFDDVETLRLYEEAIESVRLRHQNKARIEGDVVYVTVYYRNTSKEIVIDLDNYELIKNFKWRMLADRCIVADVNGEQQQLTRVLLGLPKGDRTKKVKFKDGDKFNFRRENLKVVECKTNKKESNKKETE